MNCLPIKRVIKQSVYFLIAGIKWILECRFYILFYFYVYLVYKTFVFIVFSNTVLNKTELEMFCTESEKVFFHFLHPLFHKISLKHKSP